MNSVIDHFDVYYLANNMTVLELRREVRHADIKAAIADYFRDTLYADSADDFPWLDYAAACREAIKTIQEHNRKQPRPEVGGKRIDIDALKSRLDIVTEVEHYTQLRKSGNNRYVGRCPLHEDRHPSMTVYADNQSWHCFQCNKGGDVIDFIMAAEGVDFKQAASILGGT